MKGGTPIDGLSFGQNLNDWIRKQTRVYPYFDVPFIFEGLVRHLHRHHLSTPGIFRIPGSMAEIRLLRERLDIGLPLEIPGSDYLQGHVAAGLLKQYLRQLPAPLLPNFLDFVGAVGDDGEVDPVNLASALGRVDPLRLKMVGFLCALCAGIEARSEANQMTFDNLATCLAPSVLYEETLSGCDIKAAFRRATHANKAFRHLLENAHALGLHCDLLEFDHALAGHSVARCECPWPAEIAREPARPAQSPLKRTVSFLHSPKAHKETHGMLSRKMRSGTATLRARSMPEDLSALADEETHEAMQQRQQQSPHLPQPPEHPMQRSNSVSVARRGTPVRQKRRAKLGPSKSMAVVQDVGHGFGTNKAAAAAAAAHESENGENHAPQSLRDRGDRFGSLRVAGGNHRKHQRRGNVLDFFQEE